MSRVEIISKNPFICMIENFLFDDEITFLLDASYDRFQRSYVVGEDNLTTIHPKRTSSSCLFQKSESRVLENIEKRVAEFTYIPIIFQEPFQLVRYGTGQQYAPHFDYFDRKDTFSREEVEKRGQRLLTILAYLVEPEKGGETLFPRLNLSIKPKKGSAIFWYNIDENKIEDTRTEHGGMPVHEGYKVAMNMWVRTKPYV